MGDAREIQEGLAKLVREPGDTNVILPEGWELEFALYRVRREGEAVILEPIKEGPRAAAVSNRLDFDDESGRWIVAGTRMPVAALIEMLAHGAAPERIIERCPYLSLADIRACLTLAADLVGRPISEPEPRNPVDPGSSPG